MEIYICSYFNNIPKALIPYRVPQTWSSISHNLSQKRIRNFNVQALRNKNRNQLYNCVPVLSGSDITVYCFTSRNIDFLHIGAGSPRQLIHCGLSGYHVRSQVQTTQPYMSIALPSSTVDELSIPSVTYTFPYGTLQHYLEGRSTPIILAQQIPTHLIVK